VLGVVKGVRVVRVMSVVGVARVVIVITRPGTSVPVSEWSE
jgi:hypothetical protein